MTIHLSVPWLWFDAWALFFSDLMKAPVILMSAPLALLRDCLSIIWLWSGRITPRTLICNNLTVLTETSGVRNKEAYNATRQIEQDPSEQPMTLCTQR